MILLDTNVLVRVANRIDPNCQVAQSAIDNSRAQGERIAVVPQNLYEFWAVATRAAGLPPSGPIAVHGRNKPRVMTLEARHAVPAHEGMPSTRHLNAIRQKREVARKNRIHRLASLGVMPNPF